MPEISIDLIRRKAEHNEGLIHTLEELSLHQEELESINDTLGCNCRRLKILYLQNNIIGKMKNLHHMKELEYLNLALNNITRVQGLESCEFLNKLDLTVNFVDMDELESSVSSMEGNRHLKDLYMMGNPCQSWEGFEAYVMARLPQLERLDGKEITRTDRIRAQQRLPSLRAEIPPLAEEVRRRKREEKKAASDGEAIYSISSRDDREGGLEDGHALAPRKTDGSKGDGGDDEKELTKHAPEVRTAIYREMAEQKKEKDDRQKENLPKDRDFKSEQEEAVARARKREEEGVIRQCNEGKLAFRFEETRAALSSNPGEGGRGDIVLEVAVPRYLDSSLIDLDVHPHYVSIVIKGKVLRLSLQAEVKAGEARARRSKTTGSLVVTMPKVDPDQSLGLLPTAGGRRAPGVVADRVAAAKSAEANDVGRTKRRGARAKTMAELMMEEAKAAGAARMEGKKPGAGSDVCGGSKLGMENPREAVSIRGMVGPRHGGLELDETPQLSEVASTKRPGPETNGRNTTTAAAQCGPTATPTHAIPPPALPTPPNDSRGSSLASSEPKVPSRIAEPSPPPAPPAGSSVSVDGTGGEGVGVIWPRGQEEVDAVNSGRSCLEDID